MPSTPRREFRSHRNTRLCRSLGGFEPLEDRRLLSVAPGAGGLTPAEKAQAQQAALVDFHGADLKGKDGPMAHAGFDLTLLFHEQQIAEARGANSNFTPTNRIIEARGDRVNVDAIASGNPQALRADLAALGMQVLATAGKIVSGSIPISALRNMAALTTLAFARPVYQPVTNVGLTTSQGDASMHSDDARIDAGVDGTGITVGVLSDTFDVSGNGSAATDMNTGDLPTVNVLQDDTDGTDEGRAMLQIVHDVAPGAALQFATANLGESVFADNIRALAAAGSDVIVDDVGYFAEPFFQDGLISQAIDEVVAGGVAYFTSAGNSGRQSYESSFVSSGVQGPVLGGGPLHDFNPGAAVDALQRVSVPLGGQAIVILQWDSPFGSLGGAGSQNDLDLILFGSDGSTLVTVSSDNNLNGDALEILFFFNDGTIDVNNDNNPDTVFNLGIQLSQGTAPSILKYITLDQITVTEYNTLSSAAWGHANSATGAGVAAAAFFQTPDFGISPPRVNDFSSLGGMPILFDTSGNRLPTPQVRQQPMFTGPDGVNTTFFGSDITQDPDNFPNFFGTSAAAPHVAAVAALMLEAAGGPGSLSPAAINAILSTTAVDIVSIQDPFRFPGPVTQIPNGAGFDFFSGTGLVDAAAAVNVATQPNADHILLFSDVSAPEGNVGTTDFVFTFTLSSASDTDVTVEFTTVGVTATEGEDFVPQSGTITFAAGELTQTVTIAVNGDFDFEPDETFMLLLTNATGAALIDDEVTGTIINDDPRPPNITINNRTQFEGDLGLTSFNFTVTLSATSLQPITITYFTSDGSAIAGSDYQSTAGTLTILPGATTGTITVPVIADLRLESDETFFLNLSSAVGGLITDTQALGTILNDDVAPEGIVYIDDITVMEDAAGVKNAVFTVAVTGIITRSVVIVYSTADGTATAGEDYLPQSGTLFFFTGNTAQTVIVPILSDNSDEPNETFFLNLDLLNGNTGKPVGTGTIVSAHPQLTQQQIVDNGDNLFTPSGSWPTVVNLTAHELDYAYSAAGSGGSRAEWMFDALAPGSYQVFTRWVPFGNRATNAPYTVFDGRESLGTVRLNQQQSLNDDFFDGEYWEEIGTYQVDTGVLRVVLSNDANGFVVADAVRIVAGGIPAPAPEIDIAVEGVSIATGDGTPSLTDGTEFGLATAGSSSVTHTFVITNTGNAPLVLNGTPRVQVTGAAAGEFHVLDQPPASLAPGATASFRVLFAPTFAGLRTAQIVVSSNDASEGTYQFTVQGSGAPATPVDLVIDDGDAGHSVSGVWQNLPNTIAFNDDYLAAGAGNGSSRSTWDFTGLGIGTYDVFVTWIPFSNRATNAPFTVSSGGAVRASVALNEQQAPSDTSAFGSAWEQLGTVNVTTGELSVALSNNANGFVVADAVRVVRRGAPPAPPTLSIEPSAITVTDPGGIASSMVMLTVQLSAPSASVVTVEYSTQAGTATANEDYLPAAGTLTFQPGTTAQTISIFIAGDILSEGDETFFILLSEPTNAGLLVSQATVTISANGGSLPLQNAGAPIDVNNDGLITPLDALLVINRLNATGPTSVASQLNTSPSAPYVDVNGDWQVTPLDALLVINYLNAKGPISGFAAASSSAVVLQAISAVDMSSHADDAADSTASIGAENSEEDAALVAIALAAESRKSVIATQGGSVANLAADESAASDRRGDITAEIPRLSASTPRDANKRDTDVSYNLQSELDDLVELLAREHAGVGSSLLEAELL